MLFNTKRCSVEMEWFPTESSSGQSCLHLKNKSLRKWREVTLASTSQTLLMSKLTKVMAGLYLCQVLTSCPLTMGQTTKSGCLSLRKFFGQRLLPQVHVFSVGLELIDTNDIAEQHRLAPVLMSLHVFHLQVCLPFS